MENGIKKTSEIEGEIVITLEEKDYLNDFRNNVRVWIRSLISHMYAKSACNAKGHNKGRLLLY